MWHWPKADMQVSGMEWETQISESMVTAQRQIKWLLLFAAIPVCTNLIGQEKPSGLLSSYFHCLIRHNTCYESMGWL